MTPYCNKINIIELPKYYKDKTIETFPNRLLKDKIETDAISIQYKEVNYKTTPVDLTDLRN